MNGNMSQSPGDNDQTVIIHKPSTEPADQHEWDKFYRANDLTLLMQVANVPYISGPLGVGPVDGEIVPDKSDRLYAIPEGMELQIGEIEPKYVPEDKRPKSQRRANKKLYSKARAYYGKTYIVTRAQMILSLIVCGGLILILSAAGALSALYLLGLSKYL